MGCLTKCAFLVAVLAVLAPFGISLAFNGWIHEYLPPKHWSIDQMPDMTGKVAIVTGPTIKGIGYESCVELAAKGAHVIMAGRSQSKGDAALAALKERAPKAKAEFMLLDLGSLDSVKAFAAAFKARQLPLHVLMNSAGIMANPFTLTSDGFESQFGTNHLGHFLLVKLLLPELEKSQPSRVISVSSAAAFIPEGLAPLFPVGMGVNWTDIHADSKDRYDPFAAYGRSKLANVLFASALDRRLAGKRIFANSCHPGGIRTNLGKHMEVDIRKAGEMVFQIANMVFEAIMMTPNMGAVTQLYLATSPEIESNDIRGKYFYPQARLVSGPVMDTTENQDMLWDLSEKLVAPFV